MPRVKRGTTVKAKHKKLLSHTKGFRHGRKNLVRMARQADTKAGQYAYRDRRNKKRDFRRLWIIQINAACKLNDIKYGIFINGLKTHKIELDRKVLSQIAQENPEEFKKLVEKVKS
ncbi:MAG: 50S ribosomal protein L20 [Berkelbacteria bacterium GW2011_GWA1_36_9]|uniref:Large ribosomal subunit protein bL20 n=1 Tax=Berkelbacteria bacterium GW2011_GWA1_36_9 TaxID=1618331 RepID=A0A0G0FC88_9BACT|nr:MAG: 50S ribosomal protein L20 [Berkelbacteria bacterium GW2011_GWA1_36_9]